METKRISVSSKRQITIPQRFFETLNIGNEVECFLRNNEIVIRPLQTNDEFSEEILEDLIREGYQGEELLKQFKRVRSKVRPAVKRMIEEASKTARESKGTGDDEMKELFGDEED